MKPENTVIRKKVSTTLEPETVKRIAHLAKTTKRGKGDVIDWAVARVWAELNGNQSEPLSVVDNLVKS